MERMIMFRGMSVDTHEWFYGSVIIHYDGECHIAFNETFISEEETNLQDVKLNVARVSANSIGQFIGVHDRAYQDIYEGDYIKSGKGIGEIMYSNERCMFLVKWHTPLYMQIRGESEPILDNHNIVFEVIGNKCETDLKELL